MPCWVSRVSAIRWSALVDWLRRWIVACRVAAGPAAVRLPHWAGVLDFSVTIEDLAPAAPQPAPGVVGPAAGEAAALTGRKVAGRASRAQAAARALP